MAADEEEMQRNGTGGVEQRVLQVDRPAMWGAGGCGSEKGEARLSVAHLRARHTLSVGLCAGCRCFFLFLRMGCTMPTARFRSVRRLEDGGSDCDDLSDVREFLHAHRHISHALLPCTCHYREHES